MTLGNRLVLLVAMLPCMLALPLAAQSPPPAPAGSTPAPPQVPSADQQQTHELEEEQAEHDISYLRSRVVFRYDYRSQEGDTSVNRLRIKSLFAFGPHQRLGVSINTPLLYKDVPGDSAGGLGDVEVQFGGNLYRGERFRTGALVEFKFQTATNSLLNGSTTTIKPAWGFTAVLTPRLELNCAFNYKRSIYTRRGTPTNEFEPDFTLSARRWGVTWWAEWDSYYLFIPGEFAQTFKLGASHAFGREHRWIVSPYYSFPLNASGRQTQYIHQVGMDVTFYLPTGRGKRP